MFRSNLPMFISLPHCNNEMLGQVQFEEIHTESECSQSDEDEESYNTSILDVFKEIEIRGDGN